MNEVVSNETVADADLAIPAFLTRGEGVAQEGRDGKGDEGKEVVQVAEDLGGEAEVLN